MKNDISTSGIIAAQWIPMDNEGDIMDAALKRHLDWIRSSGVHGVLGLGSTGEFPRFSVDARKRILERLAELADPLPVIANISDIRPQAVAELGQFARQLGLPAVALMPPYFYPMSPADQLAFFLRGAEAAGLPLFLYNFPELCGNRISLETVAAFADEADMAGIKHSGTEFSYHAPLVQMGRQKGFRVFSGFDTRLPEALALGASGCIGGMVNFVPDLMLDVFQAHVGNYAVAGEMAAQRLIVVGKTIDQLTFPLNVAAAMEARGFDPGASRSIVSTESARLYRKIVQELRGHFSTWGLSLD